MDWLIYVFKAVSAFFRPFNSGVQFLYMVNLHRLIITNKPGPKHPRVKEFVQMMGIPQER